MTKVPKPGRGRIQALLILSACSSAHEGLSKTCTRAFPTLPCDSESHCGHGSLYRALLKEASTSLPALRAAMVPCHSLSGFRLWASASAGKGFQSTQPWSCHSSFLSLLSCSAGRCQAEWPGVQPACLSVILCIGSVEHEPVLLTMAPQSLCTEHRSHALILCLLNSAGSPVPLAP